MFDFSAMGRAEYEWGNHVLSYKMIKKYKDRFRFFSKEIHGTMFHVICLKQWKEKCFSSIDNYAGRTDIPDPDGTCIDKIVQGKKGYESIIGWWDIKNSAVILLDKDTAYTLAKHLGIAV